MKRKYLLSDDQLWLHIMAEFNESQVAGIYRLHVLDEENEFIPLPRLLDSDPDGTIYIGTSARLQNRVGALRKGVSAAYRQVSPELYKQLAYEDPGAHQVGTKISRVPLFVARFPFRRLCVTLEKYDRVEALSGVIDYGYYDLETKLLREYEQRFGEKPALNS